MAHRAIALGLAAFSTINLAFAASNLAQIDSLKSKVLVNHGAGFSPVENGTALNPGDRFLVSNNAAAVIHFANGCQLAITATNIGTIGSNAPCGANQKATFISLNNLKEEPHETNIDKPHPEDFIDVDCKMGHSDENGKHGGHDKDKHECRPISR